MDRMLMATFSVKLAGAKRAQLLIDRGSGDEHLRYIDLTPKEFKELAIALRDNSEYLDMFVFHHIRESDFVMDDVLM